MNSSAQALALLNKSVEVQVSGAASTGTVIAVQFTTSGPELSVQTSAGPVLTAIHLSQVSLVKP
jgi:flagellar basal-body rod modification protein FlgD